MLMSDVKSLVLEKLSTIYATAADNIALKLPGGSLSVTCHSILKLRSKGTSRKSREIRHHCLDDSAVVTVPKGLKITVSILHIALRIFRGVYVAFHFIAHLQTMACKY